MALPEETFGPSLDGSSKYLDTSESEWPDATSVEGPLYAPGGDFILEAQYSRLGPDFFLSGEDHSFFVKGYFTHEQAPDLYTTDGSAVVRGLVATRLYIANLSAKKLAEIYFVNGFSKSNRLRQRLFVSNQVHEKNPQTRG